MTKLSEIVLSIAFGALMMFLLIKGCHQNKEPIIQYKEGKTIYDTIYHNNTITITKPVPYYVESYHTDTIHHLSTNHCDSVRYYNSGLDSAGLSVKVASKVNGVLLSQEISYQLPQINSSRIDTVTITHNADVKPFAAYGVYNIQDRTASIGGAYVNRKSIFTGTYNLNNKSIQIGYGFRF